MSNWMTRRSFLAASAMLTGSVAFGVATRQSDEDWLWMDDKWPEHHGGHDVRYPFEDGFHAIRHGNVNIIVPHSDEFRQRWLKAHRHCMVERPREKARRIRIFRHYLYGEPIR